MISFDNTEVAFSSKSKNDLRRAYWLFRIIASPSIVKFGKAATNLALNLRLPISAPIKATIFRQFCGGETIAECDRTIAELGKYMNVSQAIIFNRCDRVSLLLLVVSEVLLA